MNQSTLRSFAIITICAGSLFLCGSTPAAVVGINSPVSSYSDIMFSDTNSLAPSLLTGNSYSQNVTPWGGSAPINNTLPLTTDPTTGDFAKGNTSGNVIAGNYSVTLNSVTLNQAPLNTGSAFLNFSFDVEFQLDGAGLPSQTTVFPNFAVNGTIQNSSSGFAGVRGSIDYYGVNTAGTMSLLDTVNYNANFNTPGNFSAIVSGVPVNGTTPTLTPNTTLTLVGNITFIVDPAVINVETVPEPGTGLLVGIALFGGLLWMRKNTGRSRRTVM